jgi:parallel beta-helix repeat protein
LGSLVVLAGVVALVVCLGAARAASATLVVDDDGAECPTAPYSEIDDAVADANPGDTIMVCPGAYAPATISTRLVVRGFTKKLSASDCANDADAQNTAVNSVVEGLVVTASKVTITGLTLTGADNGVLVPGGLSSVGVTGNVIELNAVGINLNGGFVTADHNCIRHNNEPGSASGTGIYSDQGLKNASIVANAFFDNADGAAITLVGDGAGSVSGVKVDRNTSRADGDLISLGGVTDSSITNNTATGSLGSAIFVEEENAGILVDKNTLTDGEDEGIAVSASAGFESTGLTISNNKVTGNAGAATAEDVGIAVHADSLLDSTISKNTVTGNLQGGLRLELGNDDNLIEKNKLQKNLGTWDCFDEGTSSVWKSNKGKTQNVPGLCKGAKTV